MNKYFIIGPFDDGNFYIAYRYSFCNVCVPVLQCTSEKAAQDECNRMNRNVQNATKSKRIGFE